MMDVAPIKYLGETRWPCPVCKKYIKSFPGLKTHINWCHEGPEVRKFPKSFPEKECPHCGNMFPVTHGNMKYCTRKCQRNAMKTRNRDKRLIQQRKTYYKRHEYYKKQTREYGRQHREERSAYHKKWYAANREKMREYHRMYYLRRKASMQESNEKREGG